MLILGIESSCDETGAAILKITETKDGNAKVHVLANIVSSQIIKHKRFGGVVPQLAAKLHQENMAPVLEKAFKAAKIKREKIDLIAVAKGPGLIPALLVGVSAAKALAWGVKKPLVGVNHMEGHVLSAFLGGKNFQLSISNFQLPWLILLVSGGHTQLVLMEEWLNYEIIGETRDDAAGEAFDKVAKMLGLGYPGGAKIEQLAGKGNPKAFNFPRPMMASKDYDFSFSGLKTAVKNTIEPLKKNKKLSRKKIFDIAASFQTAVIDVLASKTLKAAKEHNIKTLIIGGGVAANKTLRDCLRRILNKDLPQVNFLVPQKEYTGDNAAMIALAGYFRAKAAPRLGLTSLTTSRSGQTGKFGRWENVQADANLELS